jgi:hypothetical protein
MGIVNVLKCRSVLYGLARCKLPGGVARPVVAPRIVHSAGPLPPTFSVTWWRDIFEPTVSCSGGFISCVKQNHILGNRKEGQERRIYIYGELKYGATMPASEKLSLTE